jgi:hypothetical protein
MKFLEKSLEDIIYETENSKLNHRGLSIEGRKYRQVKLGNYGISDIITFEKPVFINRNEYLRSTKEDYYNIPVFTIYELKKDIVNYDTLIQSINYYKGLLSWFNKSNIFNNVKFYDSDKGDNIEKDEITMNIVMIGRKIDCKGSFSFIPEVFNNIKIYTYDYNFDGIYFKEEYGYALIDEGFNLKK